jgi:hypothetical protein
MHDPTSKRTRKVNKQALGAGGRIEMMFELASDSLGTIRSNEKFFRILCDFAAGEQGGEIGSNDAFGTTRTSLPYLERSGPGR